MQRPPLNLSFFLSSNVAAVYIQLKRFLSGQRKRDRVRRRKERQQASGSFVSLAKNEAPQGVERPFFGERETIEMPADTSEHRSFIFNRLRSSSIHFTQQHVCLPICGRFVSPSTVEERPYLRVFCLFSYLSLSVRDDDTRSSS